MNHLPSRIQTVEDRLRAAGIIFDRLDDVPASTIRQVNRAGFSDMRSIILPPQTIRNALKEPLVRDLLVTRIGHAVRLAGHYIPRPEGSLDHILILCPQGRGWLKMCDRQWKVGPADMLCLPAGVPHWYGADTDDPWSNYWIHFTGQHASEYFRFLRVSAERPVLHFEDNRPLVHTFEEMWSAMKAVHVWENLVHSSLHLLHFLHTLRENQQDATQASRSRAEAVQRTAEFLSANLSAEISAAELADLAGMSLTRFTVEFRRRNACSPMEYLSRLRIQRACELLRDSPWTIGRIAKEVGYSDPYYFSRAFKKAAGCSPQAFRRESGRNQRSTSMDIDR